MPTLQELLRDISKQKSILDSLRPISSENMLKIRQKFVLEYNYHSNHLEGNSLTIQETYSMLMNSYSPRESKPLRDIDELRGHIKTVDALGLLEDVVKDKKDITESLVRDLNKMILVENFKKRRKDENGDDIFVDIIVGQYKSKPNSVVTQTGEMFRFADPAETAPLVHDLLDWYNRQKDTLHPLELAAIFHYKFIRIHPFDDGNGRVARLLMNLILQSNGYPIVIISSEEKPKEEYYKALMDTDANLIDLHDAVHNDDTTPFNPFVSYIGERLLKSLDWTIRGARGEDISDVSDIIKEAKLWSELHSEKNRIKETVTLETSELYLNEIYDYTFTPVLSVFDEVLKQYLKPFYKNVLVQYEKIDQTYFDDPFPNAHLTESVEFKEEITNSPSFIYYEELRQYFFRIIKNYINKKNSYYYDENPHRFIYYSLLATDSYTSRREMEFQFNIEILNIGFNLKITYYDRLNEKDILICHTKSLLYKIEPNEDYKEAIKEPLRELSEFLKKKLFE